MSQRGPTWPRNREDKPHLGPLGSFYGAFFFLHKVAFLYLCGHITETVILDQRLERKMKTSRSHLCSWDEQGEIEKIRQRAFMPEITQLCEKSSLLNTKALNHQNNCFKTRKEGNKCPSKAQTVTQTRLHFKQTHDRLSTPVMCLRLSRSISVLLPWFFFFE